MLAIELNISIYEFLSGTNLHIILYIYYYLPVGIDIVIFYFNLSIFPLITYFFIYLCIQYNLLVETPMNPRT